MSTSTTQQGDFVFAQRDRFEHHLFRAEKFCRGYAWDWLVANAVWREDGIKCDIAGKTVQLEKGQLAYSIRLLAEEWNWDKAKVARFIRRLILEGMISRETEHGVTVITILDDGFVAVDGGPIRHDGNMSNRVIDGRRDGIPQEMRDAVLERDGEICKYCETTHGPFEFDHVVPVSQGGLTDTENLVVACRTCNRSKGARTPEQWGGPE